MYAEVVINIEAPLQGTFHYGIPGDLEGKLEVGHLIEVEFGRRLAQGIVLALSEDSPVDEVKPVIGLVDPLPVIYRWQIELAKWLSHYYLTPLNACIRLILPPGLTRWSDISLALNPKWDGTGPLTETQRWLVVLLRERGDLRGRQIGRARPKGDEFRDWKTSANQLVRRSILIRASILDPPRMRPKRIKIAELIVSPRQITRAALSLGRKSKQSDLLHYLLTSDDPLPREKEVLEVSGTREEHLAGLESSGLIIRIPPGFVAADARHRGGDQAAEASAGKTDVNADSPDAESGSIVDSPIFSELPAPLSSLSNPSEAEEMAARGLIQLVEQPASVALALSPSDTLKAVFRLRNAEKYDAVLSYLAELAQPAPVSQIYKVTSASLRHLRKLSDLGLISLDEVEVWRDPLADRDFVPSESPKLTKDQESAWREIKRQMDGDVSVRRSAQLDEHETKETSPASRPAFLLHGVTGSGKTEIYMNAVAHALEQGRTAIILVPEIALTPQSVRRFAARFPDRVAVLHSRLSDGERYDTWRRAREGRFDIIIGPRSALFTPLPNIGVIVLDEEHDDSYKQTPPVPPPYYHAREAAVELARIVDAVVILGDATPDVVSYQKAKTGQYRLLELRKRIMGHRQRIEGQAQRLQLESQYSQSVEDPTEALTIELPPVKIVDLRQELRAGNRSIFSRALHQQITETLERGEQAILFLNRRGTSTFIICRDCGLVVKCPRCDSPLTYHRPGMMLVCHYCGRKENPPENCPRCGSSRIRYFGLGTEEVERRVQERWPEARTVRWDRDTTAGKDKHEALLTSFINQESDILVGTQMIAKGLDLPLVTLVGVISADVTLGLPDFGTGERAFQLLAQVAGRAGRGLLGGRVIIQTYQPKHYAIQAAAEHDYERFFAEEMHFRTQQGLPPLRRMAKLSVADPINARAEKEAKRLALELSNYVREKQLRSTELFGPIPPFFNRLDGRYRWQIVIRSPDPRTLLEDFQVPGRWVLDIDPVSTL